MLDAEAQPVDGWNETSEPDDKGHTILTWSGGELPPGGIGELPISFTVPDTVGELLVFPAIDDCANGEELAWIDGVRESEFPAPRVLVLDADAKPAESIGDVAEDAPGRDLLTEVIEDVDNPRGATATTDVSEASTVVPSTEGKRR